MRALIIMKQIFRDKYLRIVWGLSFLILFFIFFLAVVKLRGASTPLILHFDVYKGVDFFGSRLEIFGILISAFIIILINALLANFLYSRERFLSYLFGFSGLGVMILILIAMSVIISIN